MARNLLGALMLLAVSLAGAQGTKWHPGHYIMLNGEGAVDEHLWQIAELRNDEAIQGFLVRFSWYHLEPAQDEYDFSVIDRYLQTIRYANTPKRLVVRIMDRDFITNNDANIVPDYLREEAIYNGGIVASSNGYVARLWEEPVMSRLIKLYEALGRRYDSDPWFEGAFTEESTLSFPYPDFPPGYSHELLAEQYVRFMSAVKATMPTSNLFFNANWIGSPTIMADLYQEMRNNVVGAGGSNVIPGRPTQGQRVLIGEQGADYRLELPIANGVETAQLRESTPEEIATYAYDVLHSHYLFWIRKTWGELPDRQWYSGILPYLRSEPPIRTRCPNVYGICMRENPRRPPSSNSAPVVSAGPDATLLLPESAMALAGSVTDDGQPMELPTIEWTQVAGPEPSAFADAASPTSQVTFLVAGTYVLRLTANDGELETVDEVTVTVVDANAPPEVNAGSDLTIRWPTASVTLAGSASDDGELNATLALQWTLLSGPSAVAFGSAEAPSTTVTFPSEGVYVLRLTAYDGEFEVGDDVAVTVNSESPPPSEPPPPPPPPPSSPPAEEPPAEEPPAEEPPAEQPPPVGGGGAGGAGDPDTGGGDAGTVVVPAGGSGGGRFNLLELLLLGALALVGRHRARRLGNDPVGITH